MTIEILQYKLKILLRKLQDNYRNVQTDMAKVEFHAQIKMIKEIIDWLPYEEK